jgi:PAS domain S-box-containing protein
MELEMTERKGIGEAFQDSEKRYRTLYENVPVGVYRTTPEGKILSANPTAIRIWGYDSEEELLAQKASDLYADPMERRVFIDRLMKEGTVSDFEVRFKRKDGATFWGSLSATGFIGQDGSLTRIDGILQDITGRKQAEEALQESEERYRSVTETSVDAIVTANSDGLIASWNKGATLIFGFGQEMVGESVTLIIPKRYREAHDKGVRHFLETGEKHMLDKKAELSALRKDGTEFPIELSLSSWQSSSGVFFGAILRDISERKRIERLRDDVNRMMRHDLKSPLIGIRGMAELLFKGHKLTVKQRKTTAMIKELSERMLRFIERARDLFLMEEGNYILKPCKVDLFSIFQRIEKEMTPLALRNETGLRFTLFGQHADLKTGYPILGEENLIEIMFANLIKNAVEASSKGASVNISVESFERLGRAFHRIDIHNVGVVPVDVRETFFEPYATSGKEDGTGLGTHSALLIARTHQGDIDFTTSEQEGTHVIVCLPKEL